MSDINGSLLNIRIIVLLHIFVCFFSNKGVTQYSTINDSSQVNKTRLHLIITTETMAFGGSLYLLNNLWYKDFPRSTFHFFNDNSEWLQMDKFGHIATSYNIGELGYKTLKWANVENRKAIWYGGCLGSAYLLTIEIFDGFSSKWGFSKGDFAADILGSAAFMSQQFLWNEQRIKLKWSYHQTKYADYRPDLLGKDITQTWLKDYNGQTYWLSGNFSAFMNQENKFPKWLNVAIGYGAEGMIGGSENPAVYNGITMPYFKRYRQFYFAPDIDFARIKTKSRFFKSVFFVLNYLKFPTPAIEYSKENNFKFRYIYF
jgi:hypothetical protein